MVPKISPLYYASRIIWYLGHLIVWVAERRAECHGPDGIEKFDDSSDAELRKPLSDSR
jgi:hypothetical protein